MNDINSGIYSSCHGLVGDITKYILDTAPRPQPALALSAALSAVSVLKAHKVQTPTGLRTNLYCLALGPSGSGKEHPAKVVKHIFKHSGNEILLTGEPASDSGLLKSLSVNNGKALLIWDEFGHALGTLTSAKAGAHHRKIVETMLKLFSSAGSLYLGKEYSNFDGRQSRKDLDQPNLSVYASTVPHRFFESLNSDYVVDGFLPRWLVFEVENPDVESGAFNVLKKPPKSILKQINDLNYLSMNAGAKSRFDSVANINPEIVHVAAETAHYKEYFDEARRAHREARNHALEAIFARGFEHQLKVALTICDKVITQDDFEVAFEIVNNSNIFLERAIKANVSDNLTERESRRLESIIADCGAKGITRHGLIQRSRFLSSYRREQVLSDLLESGRIVDYEHVGTGERKKKIKCYYSVDHLRKSA